MSTNGTANVWETIDFSKVSTAMDLLPTGDYTLQILPGAKYSDFDPGRVEFAAAVVGGEQNGRRIFVSYPNPAKQDWSPKQFKKLVEVLGEDITEGESPVEYLNRNAGLRFEGTVDHRTYEAEGGKVTKAQVNIFKPRVAWS